jgi:hypothetical protein
MHAPRCNLLARPTLAVIAFALAVPAGTARAQEASEPPAAPVDGVVDQATGEGLDPAGGGQNAVVHTGVLVRNVNEGIRSVSRKLASGRVLWEGSLRDLRQDVEELVPAVDALERHRVVGPGVPGGQARFERAVRRAVAGAAVLVAAFVRSGGGTAESERLLGLLRRFAGISPGADGPDRPGAAYAAPGAAAHLAAYTQAATQSSSGWLAAAALLLTVVASGSFASIVMRRWDLGASPRRRGTRGSTPRA